MSKTDITCKHCGKVIVHIYAQLWHSTDSIFPQYCVVDPSGYSKLHEPLLTDKQEVNNPSK